MYKLRPAQMTRAEVLEIIRLALKDLTERASAHKDDRSASYVWVYDACINAADALVAAYGFASAGEAGHENVFQAAEGLLRALGYDAEAQRLVEVRQVIRPKRHEASYERVDAVSDEDLRVAQELARVIVPALIRQAAIAVGIDLVAAGVDLRELAGPDE